MNQHGATGLYAATLALVLSTSDVSAQGLSARGLSTSRAAHRLTVAESVSESDLQLARKKFSKLSKRRQKAIYEAVRRAVGKLDDPYLRSLEEYAERGRTSDTARYKPLNVAGNYRKSDTATAKSGALVYQVPFHSRSVYRFAYGDIAEHRSCKRTSKSKRLREQMLGQLEDLLAGLPLDVDLAFAAILRELDDDRSADAHAVFLDSWHHGAETFYHALERTAGGKGVFCYDAMLTDWVRRCVPKNHPERKAMIRSLDATHTAFFRAAATYRSYRSVREMVALSLVLAPDQRMPEQLARRYEDNGGGVGYSTRDVVSLLLAANEGDIAATVRSILSHVEGMPEDSWHSGFNAVHGIYATHKALMGKLTAGGRHTDQILANEKLRRKALRDRVAGIARAAFVKAVTR